MLLRIIEQVEKQFGRMKRGLLPHSIRFPEGIGLTGWNFVLWWVGQKLSWDQVVLNYSVAT